MNIYEIGSVTYCTNTPKGHIPDDLEADYVAAQVESAFREAMSRHKLSNELHVLNVEYGVGCILTTITIGAAIPAIYKFIKDYPKFRPGLLLLLKDINGIFVRLKHDDSCGSTYMMRDDMLERPQLENLAKVAESGGKPPATVTKRRSRSAPRKSGA